MTPAPADMADTAAKPVLSRRQRRKGRGRDFLAMQAGGQAASLEIARAAKAEKRAARIKAKVEGGLSARAIAKARKENPAKRSRAWRYMLAEQITGGQYSAAVEYADLHRRCQDTKVSSYGDTRGGGDGSGVSEAQLAALRKLKAAERALDAMELPIRALVDAVCFMDIAASDFMRDIELDPNKGLPLLRLGLNELARLWRMPVKRAASGD